MEKGTNKWAVRVALLLVALLTIGCVGIGVDNYREFKGAVKSGATCEQLFDMAANFDDGSETMTRIDDDLRAIGCTSPSAERSDR